jgi:hypothetical protein
VIASGMEKQLEKVNAPAEIIEQKKGQLIAMREVMVFISKLYTENETLKNDLISIRIKNDHAEAAIKELMKMVEDWKIKYDGVINF